MFEKLFKMCFLILIGGFLILYSLNSQNRRYEIQTIQGSPHVFDTHTGKIYSVIMDIDQSINFYHSTIDPINREVKKSNWILKNN